MEPQGRIVVLGSAQMFDDKYIDKEENSKIMDFVFKWLRPVSAAAAVPALLMCLFHCCRCALLPSCCWLSGC